MIGYVNIWHENNITYHLQNIFKTEQGENVDIELVNAIAFDSYTHGYYEVIQWVGNAFKDVLQLKNNSTNFRTDSTKYPSFVL